MTQRIASIWLALAVAATVGCGKSNEGSAKTEAEPEEEEKDGGGEEGEEEEEEEEEEEDAGARSSEEEGECGDGVVEGREECDDGNDVEDDGCTGLCEFSCEEDADCDDLYVCNGQETCTQDHTCAAGTDDGEGDPCGDNASCYQGECLEHICGNELTQPGEECDDGNQDDEDGCMQDCRFTCVSGHEVRGCSHVFVCDPSATCDEETHICEPGTSPLPNGTLCGRGSAYCEEGVCMASNCGDGEQEPNEECDLGDENGEPDSQCSAECTLSVCGDGEIEGFEHCEDGNLINTDGCDARCKAEVVFRLTELSISREPAPSWCVFADNENQGNAFAKIFPEDDLIIHTTMQTLVNLLFLGGGVHVLVHALDLDDPTMETADPLVHLGMSMGEGAIDWISQEEKLDFPIEVHANDVDEDNVPTSLIPAEIVTDGDVVELRTTAPGKAGFSESEADFTLYGAMTRAQIDPPRSRPRSPPDLAAGIALPQTVGASDEEGPRGVLCGAMLAESFRSIPFPAELGLLCPDFTPCEDDQDPKQGECSSILDFLSEGCGALLSPMGEPDADIDGDGIDDAYSAVVGTAIERIKMVGVGE